VTTGTAGESMISLGDPLAFVDPYNTYNTIATTALSTPSHGPFFR